MFEEVIKAAMFPVSVPLLTNQAFHTLLCPLLNYRYMSICNSGIGTKQFHA